MALIGVISPGTCALWGHPRFLAESPRVRGPSSRTQESAPDQPCLTMQVGRGGGGFHPPPQTLFLAGQCAL